ncbi:MAG: PAS domain S-box protein [Methanomicrobiales archaeon]|nr:PAS domain S-box protein [Methanomicrobiales archaeon]
MSDEDDASSRIFVLYVDDEEGLLDIGKIFLERIGLFRVDTLPSAQNALSSPTLSSYDVIVSDYQMPGMDGIEFLKTVREKYGDIPFILFTGRGREEVVIEAINNGADFYLQKGGEPKSQFAELSHKIRQAVRRKQAEKSVRESEKRVSDIINFLPDATFAINRKSQVIAWNRALQEMTGFSAASLIGKDHSEYVNAFYTVDRPLLIDLIDEPDVVIRMSYPNFYRDGSSIIAESETIRRSGEPIFVTIKVSRLYNDEGEITGAIETIRDITPLKKAEQELIKSEQRYRSIVHDQTDYIARFSSDGTITFINESYRQNFAPMLDLKEIEGKNVRDLMQIQDYPVVEAFLRSLSGDSPVKEMEREIMGTDGEKHWQLWTVRALFDEQGIPVEYQVSGKDITRIKQDEEEIRSAYEELSASEESLQSSYQELLYNKQALQDSESRLRTIIENSEEAISMIDEEGKVIEWNPSSERISHIPKEEALGMYIWDLTSRMAPLQHQDAEHKNTIKQALRSSLKTGVPVFSGPQIITGTRPDGTTIITRQRIFPIPTDRGFRFGSISHDITKEKLAEEALRENEERFRAMAERSSDLILLLDRQLCVTYASPAARTVLGYEPEELLGKSYEFAVLNIFDLGGDVISHDAKEVLNGESKGKRVYERDMRIIRKDGTRVYVSIHAVPIFQDGVLAGAQASIREITDRG